VNRAQSSLGERHHTYVRTDRDSQYASQLHRDLLEKHGFIQNMSRKGNSWNNAVMECFSKVSNKSASGYRRYANHLEAIKDINHYIVAFYNTQRRHSTLGYRSPTEYEKQNHPA